MHLEKELEEKEGDMGDMAQGHMAPEEFRRIKQDFRSKSTQYKRIKAELNELRAERGKKTRDCL